MSLNSEQIPPIFLPPIHRSMETLDRAFFSKTIPLAIARPHKLQSLSSVRKSLMTTKEMLQIDEIKTIINDPDEPAKKLILLQHGLKHDDPTTWSPELQALVKQDEVEIRSYDLHLSYANWTARNILHAILPPAPEDEERSPSGFEVAGHVAHLNLRDQFLPYKHLIGEILLDKVPGIRTVINKTMDVGSESIYRTFPFETLAGEPDLNVTVREHDCEFKFNFAKVYWNSRLGTEHGRLIEKFAPGEAVCDAMAGVGPFSVPAGKRRIFVHANDLNPAAAQFLSDNITLNKVADYVRPYCQDARDFIRETTHHLRQSARSVNQLSKTKVQRPGSPSQRRRIRTEIVGVDNEPTIFHHYIMNLPASAIEMLDAFKGIYSGRKYEFERLHRRLPFIHLYLFHPTDTRLPDPEESTLICKRLTKAIGAPVELDNPDLELDLHYVRLVSPHKRMWCASFRIPEAVAFAKP
jgi:tRNA (guanine37-N1)-methyltransferase